MARTYLEDGCRAAIQRSNELLLGELTYRRYLCSEWWFDRRHGIDTRGVVAVYEPVAASAEHQDGVRYEPTRPGTFKRLADALPLELPPADYTFIDLGCGKGRVLLLAALQGFGRVVGVELDDKLVTAARANLRSARLGGHELGHNVEVVHADAAKFLLPPEPSIIYMYNPFGEGTVSDVARNVQRSWEQKPRSLLIAYYNPKHEHLLEEVSALERVPSEAGRWSFFRMR